jgi:alkylated DNA repair dioxygenase AlkB
MSKSVRTTIKLTERSHLILCKLPQKLTFSSDDFEQLWKERPDSRGSVVIIGRRVDTPRWHASYLRQYKFSGIQLGSFDRPIPQKVKEILEWANRELIKDFSVESGSEAAFNQVLVNWYRDGHDYIGKHSDDERQLVPRSPIFSLSLGAERKFRLRTKKDGKISRDILLNDRDIVMMCGDTQKEFTHEIVKIAGKKGENVGRRINVTFRMFQ